MVPPFKLTTRFFIGGVEGEVEMVNIAGMVLSKMALFDVSTDIAMLPTVIRGSSATRLETTLRCWARYRLSLAANFDSIAFVNRRNSH